MANIFKTICTKFYQNRPGFVDDVIKNIWCVFGFTVPIAVREVSQGSVATVFT